MILMVYTSKRDLYDLYDLDRDLSPGCTVFYPEKRRECNSRGVKQLTCYVRTG